MVPILANQVARRYFLDRHLLSDMPSGAGRGADLSKVIQDLGFVQLDSVNTFARAHDLILWARRQQYRPKALNHLLSRDRALFEHWTHDASTLPISHFPYWRMRFQRSAQELEKRWEKDRRAGFLEKVDEVLRQISEEGWRLVGLAPQQDGFGISLAVGPFERNAKGRVQEGLRSNGASDPCGVPEHP